MLRCQRIIFSAYRTDQFNDPEGYMASLGAVFEQYPIDVVVWVTDPRTGVQRGCKWPPTIAEIVAACEARVADLERERRYRNWGRNEPPAIEPPRENRPTYEELKAKYPWEPPPEKKWYDYPPKPWDDLLVETDADGKRHIKVSPEFRKAMKERDDDARAAAAIPGQGV